MQTATQCRGQLWQTLGSHYLQLEAKVRATGKMFLQRRSSNTHKCSQGCSSRAGSRVHMPKQFVYDSLQEADIALEERKQCHALFTRERSSCLKKQILAERIECD